MNNKIKKFFVTVILCSTFIFSLCAGLGLSIEIGHASEQKNPQILSVWSHAVHEQLATGFGGAQIDVASEFEKKYNVKIEWNTLPYDQMLDKGLRQLSLREGEADVIFYVDDWCYEDFINKLEPLDAYMEKEPLDDMEDVSADFWRTFSFDGYHRGVPYRIALQILFYNEAYYEKYGISEPPNTIEELVEIAKKTTFKRDDGAQVYGLIVLDGVADSTIISFIRACGGQVLDKDYQVRINEKEAVYAISLLKDLYQTGSIPPNYTSITPAMVYNMVYQGIASNALSSGEHSKDYNDPEKSIVAGDMKNSYFPASEKTSFEFAPAKASYWAAGIPKNSSPEKKQIAYEFLRFFSGVDAQIKMALNGNIPVRISSFEDPE